MAHKPKPVRRNRKKDMEKRKKIKLPRKRKKIYKKEQKFDLDYWTNCVIMEMMRDEEHRIPNFRTKFPRVIEYYNPKNPIIIKSIKQYY